MPKTLSLIRRHRLGESTTVVKYDSLDSWTEGAEERKLTLDTQSNPNAILAYALGAGNNMTYFGYWNNKAQTGFLDNKGYNSVRALFTTIEEDVRFSDKIGRWVKYDRNPDTDPGVPQVAEVLPGTDHMKSPMGEAQDFLGIGDQIQFTADDFRRGQTGTVVGQGVPGYWRIKMDGGLHDFEYAQASEVQITAIAVKEATSPMKKINALLTKHNWGGQLARGNGYYYLYSDAGANWIDTLYTTSIAMNTIYPENIPLVIADLNAFAAEARKNGEEGAPEDLPGARTEATLDEAASISLEGWSDAQIAELEATFARQTIPYTRDREKNRIKVDAKDQEVALDLASEIEDRKPQQSEALILWLGEAYGLGLRPVHLGDGYHVVFEGDNATAGDFDEAEDAGSIAFLDITESTVFSRLRRKRREHSRRIIQQEAGFPADKMAPRRYKLLVYPPGVGHNQSGQWMALWRDLSAENVDLQGLGKDREAAVADLQSKRALPNE